MICPSCGHELKEGTKFCTSCGASLTEAAQVTRPLDSAPTQPLGAAPAAPQQPQPDVRAPQPQMPQPQQAAPVGMPPMAQQPKKSRKGLVIGIIAAVVVAIVAGIAGITIGNRVSDDALGPETTEQAQAPVGQATEPAPAESNAVVGSWELTSVGYGGYEIGVEPGAPDALMYMAFDFYDDGTGTVYLYSDEEGESGEFQYSIDGNAVSVVDTNGADLTAAGYDFNVSGDELVLSGVVDGEEISMTFSRTESSTLQNHWSAFGTGTGVSSTTSNDIGQLMGAGQMVADVTGSWTLDTVYIEGYSVSVTEYRELSGDTTMNMDMVFNSDGTGSLTSVMEGVTDSVDFTYEFDGEHILIYDVGSSTPDTDLDITYDSDSEMILMDYTSEGMQMTFYRTGVN